MLNKLEHRINFVESHKLKPTTHWIWRVILPFVSDY